MLFFLESILNKLLVSNLQTFTAFQNIISPYSLYNAIQQSNIFITVSIFILR